jgi:predicted Na+-dependent transporter
MSSIKKITSLLAILLIPVIIFAQQKEVSMADQMRSNGRIYVVVAVMLTILIGLVLYVVRLDRKISKLEKDN